MEIWLIKEIVFWFENIESDERRIFGMYINQKKIDKPACNNIYRIKKRHILNVSGRPGIQLSEIVKINYGE